MRHCPKKNREWFDCHALESTAANPYTKKTYLQKLYQNWTEMKETEQKALKNNARERITLEVY